MAKKKPGRPIKKIDERVMKLSVSLPPNLVQWIDDGVKMHTYASRSHALTVAVTKLKALSKYGPT